MDTSLERANREINRYIDRRSGQRKKARAEEEAWKESVRRYHEKRQEQNRREWIAHYRRMAQSHEGSPMDMRTKLPKWRRRETEMTQQDFGTEIVNTVNEFRSERDTIRNKPAYQFDTPDYASDEVKRQLVDEARQAEEAQLIERTRERVEATLSAYPDKVMARREKLQQKIMEPLTSASADLLSRLAISFEDDLETMLDAALATGNAELTGMLFAEAVRRDLPDMQQRIATEAGGDYQEFLSLPKDRDEAYAKAAQQRHLVSQHL